MIKPKVSYKNIDKVSRSDKEIILEMLKKSPLCVSDIQKELNISQPRASNLLKELLIDGYVDKKKIKTFVFYGLKDEVKKNGK